MVATTGNPGQSNYVAAKGALNGLTKSMALEVATRGVTVNCISPGFIDTAMTAKLTDDQKLKITERSPIGRMGTGDDVSALVLFLVTNEAGYITGQNIHVNGGLFLA